VARLPTYVQRREELGLEWSLALVAACHQRHLVSWRFSYRACFCLLACFFCSLYATTTTPYNYYNYARAD